MPTKKAILQLLIVAFTFGAFLNMIGVIVFQASFGITGTTGNIWYYAFYYIAAAILFTTCMYNDVLEQYRLAIVGFASVGFVYTTSDLQLSILNAQFSTNGILAGMVLKSIGLFFVVFPFILIILITGSESNSFVGRVYRTNLDPPTTSRVSRGAPSPVEMNPVPA